jgi:hypothetical protein
MAAVIIPFELPLPLVLQTIEGNVDYRTFRDQLLQINENLVLSGLEDLFIRADLERWLKGQKRVSAKAQQYRQLHSRRALRCNIARLLLREDYRGFAARLADSPLLQLFCGISEVDRVQVPAKSTLQRYATWWTEAEVRQLAGQLLQTGAQEPEKLVLPEPVDLERCWIDTTCVKVRQAGRIGMAEGMPKCSPVLLEPIMKVEIAIPNEATARVNGMIPQRRGQILGFDAREGWPGWDVVRAQIPESEMADLIVELRSATAGVGTFTAKFHHLAELTGRLADNVLAAHKAAAE